MIDGEGGRVERDICTGERHPGRGNVFHALYPSALLVLHLQQSNNTHPYQYRFIPTSPHSNPSTPHPSQTQNVPGSFFDCQTNPVCSLVASKHRCQAGTRVCSQQSTIAFRCTFNKSLQGTYVYLPGLLPEGQVLRENGSLLNRNSNSTLRSDCPR